MSLRHATLALFALALTAGCSGDSSEAQSGCSVASLKGAYIYALDGFLISGDTASQRVPFAQAGREVFNGDGTMSGFGTINQNGVPHGVAYAGTYTVAADCTGNVTFIDADEIVSHFDIFIEDGGEEFGFIQTDPGVVTAAFERRRSSGQGSCSNATLKGRYVYAGDGFEVAGDGSTQRTPVATSGIETYDGNGNVSGIDTSSFNGVVTRSTYTATYDINPDCSGLYRYNSEEPTPPYDLFLDPSGEEWAYVSTGSGLVTAGYQRK